MNDAQLAHFRQMADWLRSGEAQDWQWIGPHLSQRMFGISQRRAEELAQRHGGEAKRMPLKLEGPWLGDGNGRND